MYRTRMQYGGTCVVCGEQVPKGAQGWYDRPRRKIACATHDIAEVQVPTPAVPPLAPAPPSRAAPSQAAISTKGLPKLIKVKYAAPCTVCGTALAKGVEAFWIPDTNVMVCPPCTAGEVAAGMNTSTAGAGASRIADEQIRKHSERLLAAYPMLGEHLIANARPTNDMHAWMRGADGERIVGRKLDIAASEGRIVVLHDRRMPSGGNIDHLVVGPRRICVIDAKHYRNKRITKDNDTLKVDGTSAEYMIDQVRHQRAAVNDALADQPKIADNVSAVLAFVAGKLGFSGSITHRGVFCGDLKEAVSFATWRHLVIGADTIKLDQDQRNEIGERLARAFPPAG